MLIGATLAMIGLIVHNGSSSSLALVNNILAANGSALIAYLLKRTRAFGESSSTKALLNGALAGVVSESNIDIRFSGRKWLKQTNKQLIQLNLSWASRECNKPSYSL